MDNRNLKNPNTPLVEIYDDILKFYFSKGYLDRAADRIKYFFTGKGFKAKVTNYLTPFAKYLKRYFEYKKKYKPFFTVSNLNGKIWLFIGSSNNRNSLNFLLEGLDDSIFVGNGIQINEEDKYQIPFHRTVLYFWKFPKIWFYFKKKYGKTATKYSDLIFKSIGLYEVAYDTLSKYKPKCIIVANDHSEKQRALLNAAKRLNIPVIYVQHASASDIFPALDFDLSLLEGQAALDIYKKGGSINGEVRLIGMPKFDKYTSYRNNSSTIKNIGICTNILDKTDDIYEMIDAIQKKFPNINLALRPHPGYKTELVPPKGVRLSTKSEHIFDFLKAQDCLIAGSSSVHLEALLLNVTSLYFEFTRVYEVTYDPYGYLANDLLQENRTIEQLLNEIQKNINNRIVNRQAINYYNATYGTIHEGRSSDLAVKYIEDFLNTNPTAIYN